MLRHNLKPSYTFSKHRDCLITIFEMEMKGRKTFNQIDYILVRTARKHSLINARSYINNQVNTDHRFVVTQMHAKVDYERKKNTHRIASEDTILVELSNSQKALRHKNFHSTYTINILCWKRERSNLFACIKKRKAEMLVEKLITLAEEINNAKDNKSC